MIRGLRRVAAGLLLLVLGAVPLGVAAVRLDYSRPGALHILAEAEGLPLEGVGFSLWRVGDIGNEGGFISYHIGAGFEEAGFRLDYETNSGAEEAARGAEAYILREGIAPPAEAKTGRDGRAVFSGLMPGVYFGRLSEGPEGLEAVPFIAAVPKLENGRLHYTVSLSPKMGLGPAPSPTPGPGGRLPQTGVLRWPVIALGILAAVLIGAGIRLLVLSRAGDEEKEEEREKDRDGKNDGGSGEA